MTSPYSSNPQQSTHGGQSVPHSSGRRVPQQLQPYQLSVGGSGTQSTASSVVPSTSGQAQPLYGIQTPRTAQYPGPDSPPPTYLQATSPHQLQIPFTPQSIEPPSSQFPPPPNPPPPRATSIERHHIPQSHHSSSPTTDSRRRGDSQFLPPPFPPPTNNPQIHTRSTSGQDSRRQHVGAYPPPAYPPPPTALPLTQSRSSHPSQYPTPVPSNVPHTTSHSSPPRGRQDGQLHPQQQRPSPNRSVSVNSGYSGFDSVSTPSLPPLSPYMSSQSRGSPTSPVGPYSTPSSTNPYVITPNQANTSLEPPPTRYPHVASNVPSPGNPLPDERRAARPNAPPVLGTSRGAPQPTTTVSAPRRELHPRGAAAEPTCRYPRCNAPVARTKTNELTEYCGEGHMLAAVEHLGVPKCPACLKYPRRVNNQYCGSACELWAAERQRAEQQSSGSSRSHSMASRSGSSTWNHANAPGGFGYPGGGSHYESRQYPG